MADDRRTTHSRPERRPATEVDSERRRLLRASALAGGALAAGSLPYEKPAVKSFFGTRSAWAQVTGVLQITFDGQLGTAAPGTPQSTGQDRWRFDVLEPNTMLTITASSDANLDVEIFLYGPGGGHAGDTNLLTSNPFGFNTAGPGQPEAATVTVAAAGTYFFAIEDERAPASEVAGAYSVTISADKSLTPATQVVDEGPESDARSGDR